MNIHRQIIFGQKSELFVEESDPARTIGLTSEMSSLFARNQQLYVYLACRIKLFLSKD